MNAFAFVLPGDPATLTGGYLYAHHVMQTLPALGWQPKLVSLPDTFPLPDAATLRVTATTFDAFADGEIVLVDGLAFGAIPVEVLRRCRARLIALVHHPLCVESGLDAATRDKLFASERDALAEADHIVVTSPRTAQRVQEMFGISVDRITVAPPGTATAARAQGSTDGSVRLLCVATVTPRKGHDVLVAALSTLRDLRWHLICIGSLTRDAATARALKTQIATLGLEDRVVLAGEKSGAALDTEYAAADVFALASRDEGYGMAFAEALAHGVPIVACNAGAVPETVPPEAGILVPVDDVAALAAALRQIITDRDIRSALSNGAWVAGQRLPRWTDTARTITQAFESLSARQK